MRRIVIELTDKLEECFECLNDELAAKSIINILKQRAYIELRSDGRESGKGSGINPTTQLPETDFRKESELEKDKKIDELYKMVSNLTNVISSGGIQTSAINRETPLQVAPKPTVEVGKVDLSAAMGALQKSSPIVKEEPKKIVASDAEFSLDDLEMLLK